jgi:hypothetical protein
MRTVSLRRIVVVSVALALSAVAPRSFAQEIAPVGEYTPGLPVGAWMLYPSLFVGATYDTNFKQTPSGIDRDEGVAARISPRIVATNDGGIRQTTLYGVVDALLFSSDTIAASVGGYHSYAPLADLTLGVWGNYTRQTSIFNSALMFNNNAIGPVGNPPGTIPVIINPFGTTPTVNPIPYNQFSAGGSVTKTFGNVFTSLAASTFYIAYDRSDNGIPDPIPTSHDGLNLWLSGRVGYRFPMWYVFGEASTIWQDFTNSVFNTNGYRVVGGVGTDNPYSLWQAEVYGGWQFQNQEHQDDFHTGISANQDSGVFGGRLTYRPTPYWTLIAAVDTALGVSTFLSPGIPAGIPLVSTTAVLQTTYALSRQWSVGARFGYTRADYIDTDRLDNGWLAGASFNYEIWRNLALTLDYQYTTVDSNVAFSDYTRQQVTGGLTYRY